MPETKTNDIFHALSSVLCISSPVDKNSLQTLGKPNWRADENDLQLIKMNLAWESVKSVVMVTWCRTKDVWTSVLPAPLMSCMELKSYVIKDKN